MSFTFPAVVVFILSLPGILFRFGYRSGLREKSIVLSSLTEEVAWGISVALIIHIIAVLLLPYIPGTLPASLPVVLGLVGGNNSGPEFYDALANVSDHDIRISIYLLTTSAFGFILGFLLYKLSKKYHLGLFIPLLRTESTWHDLFNGYNMAFDNVLKKHGKVTPNLLRKYIKEKRIFCVISVLVDTPNSQRIIKGIYLDHRLNASGQLDRITLTFVSRMAVSNKPVNLLSPEANRADPELEFVEMQGDRFVLPYATVKNMDLKFFCVTP
jgi:hypothetical protein